LEHGAERRGHFGGFGVAVDGDQSGRIFGGCRGIAGAQQLVFTPLLPFVRLHPGCRPTLGPLGDASIEPLIIEFDRDLAEVGRLDF
jgi:hypothetical protein